MKDLEIIFNVFYPPTDELKGVIEANAQRNGPYFPINGGSGLKDEWSAKFLARDDTGDNISDLNRLLNEMTSIYWYWKNHELPGYVGFSHYRRTFPADGIADFRDYDMIVSKPVWSSDTISLAHQYRHYHVLSDLQACIDVIRGEFDYDWGEGFRKYLLNSGTNYAPCNMFIMKRELFEEWCGFVFPILMRLKDEICGTVEFQKRDNYQKRALCFLTERMFGYWYYLKRQSGARTKELEIVEHLDYKPKGVDERGDFGKPLPRVALVALAKDEDDYLKEWVDYNLEIGFTDIYIFQNMWRYTRGDIDDPRVHLEVCDQPQPQVRCYNACIERLASRYDFMAFFDIDEFLFVKDGRSVPEFLDDYRDVDATYVNWRLFGDSGLSGVSDGNYSVIDRFTHCDSRLFRLGKPILNTGKTGTSLRFNNPHILVRLDRPNVEFRPFDPLGKVQVVCGSLDGNALDEPCELYHFRNKTWQETLKRRYGTTDALYPASFKSRSNLDTIRSDFQNHNGNSLENLNLARRRPRSLLCCIAKDEDRYIEEWIRYHLKLGFDRVVVYQNNWRASIPDDLKARVTLIEFDTDDMFAQQAAYNDCLDRYSSLYGWIAFFDVDEFLVIKGGKSVNGWLSGYSRFDAVGVNWKYFGDSGLSGVSDGNYSVARFTRSQAGLDEHIKTVVNTGKCGNSMKMHVCCHCTAASMRRDSTVAADGRTFVHSFSNRENLDGCESVAYLAHFRCRTAEEWREKCRRNGGGIQRAMDEYKNGGLGYFDSFNRNEVQNDDVSGPIGKHGL